MRPALRYNVTTVATPIGYFAIGLLALAFQSLTLIVVSFAWVLACEAYKRTLRCTSCGRRLAQSLVEPFVYSTYIKPKHCPKCGAALR